MSVEGIAIIGIFALLLLVITHQIWSAKKAQKDQPTGKQPSGFGGWLIVVAIGQTLAPLLAFGNAQSLSDQLTAANASSNTITGVLTLYYLFAAFALINAILMYRRSHRFPILYPYQWGFAIALPILEFMLIAHLEQIPMARLAQLYPSEAVSQYVALVIAAIIQVWYMKASLRVRNTFVR